MKIGRKQELDQTLKCNVNDYIAYFNWLPNWIDKYFNKVSDYLLSLVFLSLIFISIFYSNKKNFPKKKT